VLDGTGSMLTRYPDARALGLERLGELAERDTFNVFIECDSKVIPFAKQPMPATAANVAAATKFMERHECHGSGAFEVALLAALKQAPTAVWVLSDGDAPPADAFASHAANTATLVKRVRAANATKAPINTVLKFADGFKNYEWTLWSVSNASGGACLDAEGNAVTSRPEPEGTTPPKAAPVKPPARRPGVK
jgi:hypothetical protein